MCLRRGVGRVEIEPATLHNVIPDAATTLMSDYQPYMVLRKGDVTVCKTTLYVTLI